MKFSIVNKFFRWKLKICMALFYVLHLLPSCAAPDTAAPTQRALHGSLLRALRGAQDVPLRCTSLCLYLTLSINMYMLDLDHPCPKHRRNPQKCLLLWPCSSKSRGRYKQTVCLRWRRLGRAMVGRRLLSVSVPGRGIRLLLPATGGICPRVCGGEVPVIRSTTRISQISSILAHLFILEVILCRGLGM